jgi:hypothetical protein
MVLEKIYRGLGEGIWWIKQLPITSLKFLYALKTLKILDFSLKTFLKPGWKLLVLVLHLEYRFFSLVVALQTVHWRSCCLGS